MVTPSMNTRLATYLLRSTVVLLGLGQGQCGEPLLVLDIDSASVPAATTKFLLRPQLDGKDGNEVWFTGDKRRLAVYLPKGSSGPLSADLYAMDETERIIAQKSISEQVPGGISGSQVTSVSLTPLAVPRNSYSSLTLSAALMTDFSASWGSDPQNVYVAGYAGAIARCSSASNACTSLDLSALPAPLPNFKSVWGSDSSNVYAVGDFGGIIRCDGSGKCISLTSPNLNIAYQSVWGSDAGHVYVVGNSNMIQLCSSGSPVCTQLTYRSANGNSPDFSSVWGSDLNHVYIAGSSGTMVVCSAEPQGCNLLSSGTQSNLKTVWGSDANNVYAAGSGTIVRCSSASTTCTVLTPPKAATSTTFYAIWGSDAHNVYVVGDNSFGGVVLRCSSDSNSCAELTASPSRALRSVWGSDADNVYVVDSLGSVRRCSAGSNICAPLSTGFPQRVNAVWGVNRDNIYMVGSAGSIVRRRL